jgi:purine-nucleoside phosphorylase
MRDPMIEQIAESTAFLAGKIGKKPQIGMITGTGLGSLTDKMDADIRISYEDIPHFPTSTIVGHKGTLVSGELGGKAILAMEGRFHLYEGYTPQEITFPVRVMSKLGIRYLYISSAAGGLNPLFKPADLMLVTDHINLTAQNPLIGPNLGEFGPSFPDMSAVYDRDLMKLARQKALALGTLLREGVYVGITGPSLETPAETRMSTVLEVIAGVHCGLKITVIVAITNVNLPDCMKPTSIEDVVGTAEKAGQTLAVLWEEIIKGLPT